MKTLELKLKKDVLIVDAINEKEAFDTIFEIFNTKNISDYKFLCKGSELTEEIASELVDFWQNTANDGFIYENYKTNLPKKETAVESFISAVESKSFYWLENPFKDWRSDGEIHDDDLDLIYKEAEEKTFKNPLIFVKK